MILELHLEKSRDKARFLLNRSINLFKDILIIILYTQCKLETLSFKISHHTMLLNKWFSKKSRILVDIHRFLNRLEMNRDFNHYSRFSGELLIQTHLVIVHFKVQSLYLKSSIKDSKKKLVKAFIDRLKRNFTLSREPSSI